MPKNYHIGFIFCAIALTGLLSGCSPKTEDTVLLNKNGLSPEAMAALQARKAAMSANTEEESEEDFVTVNIEQYGRKNPFKPYSTKRVVYNPVPVYGGGTPDIPSPPQYMPDSNVQALMDVKVNGILYNPKNSSAIITVNNEDFLVHKGDLIFDFTIKNISPQEVTVSYKHNTYSAGIGEVIEGIVNRDLVNVRGMSLPQRETVADSASAGSMTGGESLPVIKVKDGFALPPPPKI